MKAILWEQKDDWECEGAIIGCELCYKIIDKGYLLSFDTKKEWDTLFKKFPFNPPKDYKAVCRHPDNVVVCENCLNEKFTFKRKTKLPFKVHLI